MQVDYFYITWKITYENNLTVWLKIPDWLVEESSQVVPFEDKLSNLVSAYQFLNTQTKQTNTISGFIFPMQRTVL